MCVHSSYLHSCAGILTPLIAACFIDGLGLCLTPGACFKENCKYISEVQIAQTAREMFPGGFRKKR